MTLVILDAVSTVKGYIAGNEYLVARVCMLYCSPAVVMLLQLSCGVLTCGSSNYYPTRACAKGLRSRFCLSVSQSVCLSVQCKNLKSAHLLG